MSNNIDIKIKATTTGSDEVKSLKQQIETLGNIKAFKKLKKEVRDSKTAWQAATKEVAVLAKEMQSAGTPAEKLTKKFKLAKKQAAALKKTFSNNQKQLHSLRTSLQSAGVDTGKLRKEYQKLQKQISDKTGINAAKKLLDVRSFKDIEQEIKQTKQAYKLLKKSGRLSMSELYKAELQLKKKTGELKEQTNGWARSIANAKAGLGALAGLGYAAVKAFSGYSEFSQKMAEVNTLLDVSEPKFKNLSNAVLNLSTRIPQSASQLAAAEYDIISAGVKLSDSTRVLELSSKAAVAGVTDTKTAVNIGVGVINAYGRSIDDLDNVYDILFKTVKKGVTTFPELSQSLGDVLPSARAAHVQFKDVAAAIATMTKAGIKTPQAATDLKGAINAMAAPAPEAKKKFEELGITWKGLIPTLEAIKEKSLSIDQMRKLIPDVEARTGVLALMQNMDGLKNTTDEMVHSAGAMQKAFDKMKDTPENQIKLFKNEISKLGIKLGGLVSTGLLPVVKAVRGFVEIIGKADPVTRTLTAVLTGAGPAFLIWELGLSKIVLGLKGAAIQAAASAKGLLAFQTTSAAAGLALKAAFAGSVIYTGIQLAKLAKAVYGWRSAVNDAKKAQDNLYNSSDRIMEKFKEFKDMKLPDDITGKAPEELDAFRKDLLKTKAYWVALQAKLFEKSQETTIFGNATTEAVQAGKELQKVNKRLAEVNADLKKVGKNAASAGTAMEKPAKAVRATTKQLDAFEKQAKQAYKNAKAEAKKYADKVIEWEGKIKYAKMSTADKIRELGRKGLDEEAQWNDKKLEAEQKLAAAKEAFKKGDFKLAEKLAKDSENLYADLAIKITKTDETGKTTVVKSISDTKEVAQNGVQAVGNFIQALYGKQKENAKNSQKTWEDTATAIQKQLDKIVQDKTQNISIDIKDLKSAQDKINALVKDETKHIHIDVTKEVTTTTVQKKQAGGNVLAASTGSFVPRTGNLPGYGGGDRIRALLEPGEWIIRKEAVKKYGHDFMARLNAGLLHFIPGFKTGGQVKQYSGQAKTDFKNFYKWLNDHYIDMKNLVFNTDTFFLHGIFDPLKNVTWTTQDTERPDMETMGKLIISFMEAVNLPQVSSPLTAQLFAYMRKLGSDAGIPRSAFFSPTDNLFPMLASGGGLPGYGGGDRIPALLEPGEWIIRKEAVKKYGHDFMAKLNAGMARLFPVKKFAVGGGVGLPDINMIPSSPAGTATVKHTIDFRIGNRAIGPFEGEETSIKNLITELKRAQEVS